mgnify:FL=1
MSRTKRENHIGDHTMEKGTATGLYHSLSVDLCLDLGGDVVAALIMHHIHMNVRSRLADNLLENGVPWFECSYVGICNYMIELTPKQVECGIKRLKECGLIKVVVSNKKNKYTLTQKAWNYYPLTKEEREKINIPGAENAEEENNSPKPIDKKVKPLVVSNDAKEVIEYVSQKVGKHYDYANSYVKNINSLFAAGYTKADMIAVVEHRFDDLSGTKEFNVMMNPSKLFFIKTFQSFLDDAKGDSDITMTEEQLARDVKEKEKYHLKQAELCKCEKIILGTGSCDNLPFDLTTDANTEEMMHDRARKQRYHLSEAKKFRNMAKLIKAQSVK